MSFGKKLKMLREERNMLQAELARLLNLGASSISMYEKDERDPDTDTLKRIAEIFNVSADYLLGLTEDKSVYEPVELNSSIDIKETLSNRLHNLLEEYNMSQAELSKRSAVTEATISNFLNCKQLPKLEVVSKIADVLDVSVDYLLGKTNNREIISEPIEIAASMKDGLDLSAIPESDRKILTDMYNALKNKGKSE